MKKETTKRIARYQDSLTEAIEKGTKCNIALKALKEVSRDLNDSFVISDAVKYLEEKLDIYGRTVKTNTHNIAIAELRDK